MKVEQLISQYLFLNKSLSLQEIGKFILHIDIEASSVMEKPFTLPENSISFEYDPKVIKDEKLISFIMEHTGKIKPLAEADLESYIILSKQFLNIGKPLLLKNIGSVIKTQSGVYEFTQTNAIVSKADEPKTFASDKQISDGKIDFSSPKKKTTNNKWLIPALLLIVCLVVALILFFNKADDKKNISPAKTVVPVKIDSKVDTIAKLETIKQSDTLSRIISDNINYKVVVRIYKDKIAADEAFIKLSSYQIGKNLIKYKKDSATYLLAVPINGKLSDTLMVKDSIRNLFGKNAFIDLN